jgi:hypothetical protein
MSESESIQILFRQLSQSKSYDFPKKGLVDITCALGVYIVYDNNNEVTHVGSTLRGKNGLCQRLNNHIQGQSTFSKNFLKKRELSIRQGFSFKLLEVPNPRYRALLESLTCGMLCPKYLGIGGKLIS